MVNNIITHNSTNSVESFQLIYGTSTEIVDNLSGRAEETRRSRFRDLRATTFRK